MSRLTDAIDATAGVPVRGLLRTLCEAHSFDLGRNCTYEELVSELVKRISLTRETEQSNPKSAH